MMSGHRVVGFREGWALPIGSCTKAHYFRRKGAAEVVSLCKRQTGFAGRLFEQGSFPKCRLCLRSIQFHGTPAE